MRSSGTSLPSVHRLSGGFTLLEILVALALVGLVATLAVGGVSRLAKTELRRSSAKLAGAIRYLFDRASTTGKIHRLVFDFDEGKYWAEVSDDRFFMPRERETDESREKEAEDIAREEEEKKEAEARGESEESEIDPSRYQPTDWKPKRARFEMFQEKVLKVVELKQAGLFTPRYAQPVSTGKGYLYFFPLGQTEPALVHVSDEDRETFYTLVVHPLNGRVVIHSGYIEPRVDEQFDDEGTRIEQQP
jgi:general secretion pathway protein H